MTILTSRWHAWDLFMLPAYLGLLILAEALTYSGSWSGLALHVVVLLALLLHLALHRDMPYRAFLAALCITPLLRMLSLSPVTVVLPQIDRYLVLVGPFILLGAALVHRSRYLTVYANDPQRWPAPGLLLIVAGITLGTLEYALLAAAPVIAAIIWQQLVLPAMTLLVSIGFGEEWIYQGTMPREVYTLMGRYALVYASAICAVLHIGYGAWADLCFIFVVGLTSSFLAIHTGSLAVLLVLNGLINALLFLVLPVANLDTLGLSFNAHAQTFWDWGVWGILLAVVPILLVLVVRILQRQPPLPAEDVADETYWSTQVANLLTDPDASATARERLAFLLWEQLTPGAVMLVARDAARKQVIVEMAIGSTGWRMRGFEGVTVPWTAFETRLHTCTQRGVFLETELHPISQRRGDYLLLPVAGGQRWVIVSTRSDRAGQNRALLAALPQEKGEF